MNYYVEIKNELLNNEITRKVKNYIINRSDLSTYYNVGKMLSEAGKHYGEGIIKDYSKRLTCELGKGYTETNLKYFRQFYFFSNRHTVCDDLSWSHYRILLSLSNDNEIEYYIMIIKKQNLSVRQLKSKIKSNEYERLDINTKNKLVNKEKKAIFDLTKSPILIKNSSNYEEITEKILQKLILDDISSFLKELGLGFCFIDNEYKIKLGNTFNYIDLLLYNYLYKCFVVVELKITELNANHTGQIQNYMNYIDKNVKTFDDNETMGIIICKKENKLVIEYCSDKRIIAREFSLINLSNQPKMVDKDILLDYNT